MLSENYFLFLKPGSNSLLAACVLSINCLPELEIVNLNALPDLNIASPIAFVLDNSIWYARVIALSASTFANFACWAKRLVFDLGITESSLSGSAHLQSQLELDFVIEEDFLTMHNFDTTKRQLITVQRP